MYQKVAFAAFFLLLMVMQSGGIVALSSQILHRAVLGGKHTDSHKTAATCQDLNQALKNESIGRISIKGHLVCPDWGEPIQIGQQVVLLGLNNEVGDSSIDFGSSICAFELLEGASLHFTNLVLVQDRKQRGVLPPLCRNLLPGSNMVMENSAVGLRFCGRTGMDMPTDNFSVPVLKSCETGKDTLFVERAQLTLQEQTLGSEIDIDNTGFFCNVTSGKDVALQRATLPAFCHGLAGEEDDNINKNLFWTLMFVGSFILVLVIVILLVKKRMPKRLKRESGRWCGSQWICIFISRLMKCNWVHKVRAAAGLDLQLYVRRNDGMEDIKHDTCSRQDVPDWSSIRLQDIQIGEALGKGQFSTVHKGMYRGVPVALKMIEHPGELNDTVLREVKLSKNICHRNIVAVLLDETHKRLNHISGLFTSMNLAQTDVFASEEYGSINSELFSEIDTGLTAQPEQREINDRDGGDYVTWIVMEFCDKGSLSQALHNHMLCHAGNEHQPNMAHVLLTALDIASAMQYLHFKGIIHGDLKAQNCLLMSDPTDARGFVCKVGDFGFSQKIELRSHIVTFSCGTVSHQPPELLSDGILTPAADVYAFGILLWQLVMCRAPYSNMTHQQIVVNVVEGRRPTVPPNCPSAYTSLMQECWCQSRNERPSFKAISNTLISMLSEWSQLDDFSLPGATVPSGLCSESGFPETLRHVATNEFSWLSSDFEGRTSPSPEVPLWSSAPSNTRQMQLRGPNLQRSTCCPILPGHRNNPLYNSEMNIRIADFLNESSVDDVDSSHSLPLVARTSLGRAAESSDHRRTAYGQIAFVSPRT